MKLSPLRRSGQAGMLLLLFLIPWLNQRGINLITGTLYSFAIGPLWITDPAIGLQAILATRRFDPTLLLSLLPPLLLALGCGRIFCGWLCPQNAISEAADAIASRLRIRRLLVPAPRPGPRIVVLLLLLLGTAMIGLPCISLLSAPGILSVQAAKFLYEHTVGPELALIGLIVVAELFLVRRLWCNFLCPVGTVLGLIRWRRTLTVVLTEEEGHPCSQCHACAQACQLGLDPLAGHLSPQCHNCGACIDACPAAPAHRPLSFRFQAAPRHLMPPGV